METESLDNILNGTTSEPEPAAEPEAQPPVEVAEEPAAEQQPRDEHGKFVSKGETEPGAQEPVAEPSAPPAPAESEPASIPYAALKDERSKRQALEAEIAQLRQQQAQPQPQQPQAAPDQWEDPEGHTRWLVNQAAEEAEARAIARIEERNIARSAEAARGKYEDFDETVKVFAELSQQNPELGMKLRQAENPGEFAYKTAKTHLEVQQYGSLDALIEARKKEWEATALAELQAKLPAAVAPPTISNERNVGSRGGPDWSGPKALGDILQ